MTTTVIQDAAPAITANARTLIWTGTVAVGDVVVISGETEDTSCTLGLPVDANGRVTEVQRAAPTAANRTRPYIWGATATSAGAFSITSTVSTSCIHNGVGYIYPAADGWSLAGSPNVVSIASGGTNGTGSLTGTSGSAYVVCLADWNGTSGASRTWASSATEDYGNYSVTNSSQYNAHGICTGTSTTVGLTAPTTGCQYSIAAIEILQTGGGGGGSPTIIRPRVMSSVPIIRANNF